MHSALRSISGRGTSYRGSKKHNWLEETCVSCQVEENRQNLWPMRAGSQPLSAAALPFYKAGHEVGEKAVALAARRSRQPLLPARCAACFQSIRFVLPLALRRHLPHHCWEEVGRGRQLVKIWCTQEACCLAAPPPRALAATGGGERAALLRPIRPHPAVPQALPRHRLR